LQASSVADMALQRDISTPRASVTLPKEIPISRGRLSIIEDQECRFEDDFVQTSTKTYSADYFPDRIADTDRLADIIGDGEPSDEDYGEDVISKTTSLYEKDFFPTDAKGPPTGIQEMQADVSQPFREMNTLKCALSFSVSHEHPTAGFTESMVEVGSQRSRLARPSSQEAGSENEGESWLPWLGIFCCRDRSKDLSPVQQVQQFHAKPPDGADEDLRGFAAAISNDPSRNTLQVSVPGDRAPNHSS